MSDTQPNTPAPDTTPAPVPTGEEAELLALHEHDPQVFQHSPTWKDTGKTAAERLFEIEKARGAQQDGAEKPDQQVAEQTDDLADADDIDLDAEADEPAEGEEAEQTEEREPLTPWQPPEGQEIAEYAKPHLEELDGIATDEKQRDEIVGLYERMVEAETARLSELNKATKSETVASLKNELGDTFSAYRDQVDAAFMSLPKEDRVDLKGARLADGRLLLNTKVGIDLLHRLGNGQHQAATGQQEGDSTAMLRAELAELDGIRDRDITELYRPWKNTGISGSDRALQIARLLADEAPAKPSASDIRAEERKLVKLSQDDPQLFQFGSWPGARSPADRLHAIRMGRA